MKIAALASLALLGACVMAPAVEAGPVQVGQPQYLRGLAITPLEVVEDSRCPMNARCVWAGRVVVKTAIQRGTRRLERRLTLGEPVATEFGRIVLDSATPEKMAGTDTPPEAYRFHYSIAPAR